MSGASHLSISFRMSDKLDAGSGIPYTSLWSLMAASDVFIFKLPTCLSGNNLPNSASVFLEFPGSSLLLQFSWRSRGVRARRFGGIVVVSGLKASKLKIDEDVCDDEDQVKIGFGSGW